MGRLDNAMRRAAEERQGALSVEAALDAQEVRVEEFPSETPETAEVRDLASSPIAPVEPVEAAVVPESSGAHVSATAQSLLEHADARLATKIVIDANMMPASREQYRRLAAALHQAQRSNGFKVVMVASAVAGEGKTLTAANLALTLSESYRRNVLLVDGDLRLPTLHRIFQVDGAPGLSDGLIA